MLILLLFPICFYGFSQEIKIPDNFVEASIPKLYSGDWDSLNHSKDIYLGKQNKEELIIEKKGKGERSELEIEGGKLIGIDEGEWGGALYFRTKNLQEKLIVIQPGNTVDILKFKNKIYFIQGLSHMGISDGALYELKRIKNKFTCIKVTDFDDAPAAITSFQNKILIISHKNFYEINTEESNKVTKIFENQFWESLYPNSIVAFDERNIFVGMRSGILKVNIIDKTINFYRKNIKNE